MRNLVEEGRRKLFVRFTKKHALIPPVWKRRFSSPKLNKSQRRISEDKVFSTSLRHGMRIIDENRKQIKDGSQKQ